MQTELANDCIQVGKRKTIQCSKHTELSSHSVATQTSHFCQDQTTHMIACQDQTTHMIACQGSNHTYDCLSRSNHTYDCLSIQDGNCFNNSKKNEDKSPTYVSNFANSMRDNKF